MRVELEIGDLGTINRKAMVQIVPSELQSVFLHMAFAESRNRTGLYMRRHPKSEDKTTGIRVGPNNPLRSPFEPGKLLIPDHLEKLREHNFLPVSPTFATEGGDTYGSYPAMMIVPVSDLVANLLRPCFLPEGLGTWRTFFFEDEPIDRRTYWSACFFKRGDDHAELVFMDVRFDPSSDSIFSVEGKNLVSKGLKWAFALVPLVKASKAVSLLEIAQNDYDLRKIFGRTAETEIELIYDGWYEKWDEGVTSLAMKYLQNQRPFEVFYHSILALHQSGEIRIYQLDGTLPGLAEQLASEQIVAAGLLDSGGSCALYDPWLGSYLNHSWYFREKRGAVLVFQLKEQERIPIPRQNTWVHWSHHQ